MILTACCDVSRAVRSWEICSWRAECCFWRARYWGSLFLVSIEGRLRRGAGRVGDESERFVGGVDFDREDGPGDDESFGSEKGNESIEVAAVRGAG